MMRNCHSRSWCWCLSVPRILVLVSVRAVRGGQEEENKSEKNSLIAWLVLDVFTWRNGWVIPLSLVILGAVSGCEVYSTFPSFFLCAFWNRGLWIDGLCELGQTLNVFLVQLSYPVLSSGSVLMRFSIRLITSSTSGRSVGSTVRQRLTSSLTPALG